MDKQNCLKLEQILSTTEFNVQYCAEFHTGMVGSFLFDNYDNCINQTLELEEKIVDILPIIYMKHDGE